MENEHTETRQSVQYFACSCAQKAKRSYYLIDKKLHESQMYYTKQLLKAYILTSPCLSDDLPNDMGSRLKKLREILESTQDSPAERALAVLDGLKDVAI